MLETQRNQLPRVDAFLFDMDGTLWDTEQVTERAVSQLLEEWRIDSAQVGHHNFPQLNGFCP